MRLYDQSSSTPINSDSRKWMRPINFLPNQRETKAREQQNVSSKRRPVWSERKENKSCCSVTSESTGIEISKIYKHHTSYDDFRFDIDDEQELSTKSLSTLSTHSTLRYATQAFSGYKKDILKPISIAKNLVFENNSGLLKRPSITTSVWDKPYSATDEYASYEKSESNGDGYCSIEDYLTPQLTLSTQSSEESDSIWVDFNGFGSQTPFVRENNQNKTTCRSRMGEHNGNYTKYHQMLLDGVSVNTLLKIMKNDQIDPSIISLVLVASKSNRNL